MRGVEVLALRWVAIISSYDLLLKSALINSVNEISTLADFEECHRLQELYLRKNKIPDLTELAYIQVSLQLLEEKILQLLLNLIHSTMF